jgi:hypothetical protein
MTGTGRIAVMALNCPVAQVHNRNSPRSPNPQANDRPLNP